MKTGRGNKSCLSEMQQRYWENQTLKGLVNFGVSYFVSHITLKITCVSVMAASTPTLTTGLEIKTAVMEMK